MGQASGVSNSHIELANAKLTRTLRIVGRRDDGYHLLEAEMISLDLADELEIEEGDGLEVIDDVRFVGRGTRPDLIGTLPRDGSNLVQQALDLAGLSRRIRLTKRIPPGAGLGGGSSDAAAVLRFAKVFDAELAARLGADVPFCLRGGRAFVSGVGEIIESLPYQARYFVLMTPPFSVSTPAVYRRFDEIGETVPARGGNDLEAAALSVAPELERYRTVLRQATGREPVLAGSGSTYFVECELDEAALLANALEESLERSNLLAMVRATQSTHPVD